MSFVCPALAPSLKLGEAIAYWADRNFHGALHEYPTEWLSNIDEITFFGPRVSNREIIKQCFLNK